LHRRGADLGICDKGQLLFDYRPGGVDCKAQMAEIVQRHLERIQRYCNRQFRFAKGTIDHVFLCGPPDEVGKIREQFESNRGLKCEALDPRDVAPDWQYDESIGADTGFFAAMGSALVEHDSLLAAADRGLPNLMDYFLSANRAPFWPTLARATWPIAAVLLLSVGVFGVATWKNRQAAQLEIQISEQESQLASIRVMQLETETASIELGHLKKIKSGALNPSWHRVLDMVSQSMPEGVWLDSLRVEQDGTVLITGPGATEDLIFDFVRYLKQIPVLENVNLEGQQPVRLPIGPAIKFDIKCKFNDQRNLAERTASND
jgi:Tfp pilus assembly protein PilN